MKLLAFDTSSPACSVGLLDTEKDPASAYIGRHQVLPMQQGRLILNLINEVLNDASTTLTALDGVAFGCGPGSFTGTRIAGSVAQGIAYGANLPVIPVSSLAAIAQTAYMEKKWTNLLVAVNAHMGEVYWGQYLVNQRGIVELESDESVGEAINVPVPKSHSDWVALGDGWKIYSNELTKRIGFTPEKVDTEALPTAYAIATLAKAKFHEKAWGTAFDAIPVYLR